MNLMEHLKFQAKESIMLYLDDVEGSYDQLYESWSEEFVNSCGEWWDCDNCDYTLDVFTELLETNWLCVEEYGSDDMPIQSVNQLMRNYGYYHINQGVADEIWKQEWEHKFPQA